MKTGDPLIRFDRNKIKEAGHRDVTICVIPNEGETKNIQFYTGLDVTEKETVIVRFE